MNYLGHLFLSRHLPKAVLGNFLRDMLSPAEIKSWPIELKAGISLHHRIDNFTDAHPENKMARRLLNPYFRKYAGVALDMYYDYVLYQSWDRYTSQEFESFETEQYQVIRDHFSSVPERLKYTVRRMIEGRFLYRFTTVNGQSNAFANMDHRARFETGFDQAIGVLERHLPELTIHFNRFFPDMLKHIDLSE